MSNMSKTDRYKQFYMNVVECDDSRRYYEAEIWFSLAMQDPKYYLKSLIKIIKIEMRVSNYDNARTYIELSSLKNDPKLKILLAKLEYFENNFDKAEELFCECLNYPKTQVQALYGLGKIRLERGDTKYSKKVFETISLGNSLLQFKALISLAYTHVYESDLKGAYDVLKTIDENRLNKYQRQEYINLSYFLRYRLHLMSRDVINKIKQSKNSHILATLMDKSDKTIIEHIEERRSLDIRQAEGSYFREDVDIKEIVLKVKEEIMGLTPHRNIHADYYYFLCDREIGYKNYQETCTFVVVTFPGTKDIITMYPVKLSSSFNMDGYDRQRRLTLNKKGVYHE